MTERESRRLFFMLLVRVICMCSCIGTRYVVGWDFSQVLSSCN